VIALAPPLGTISSAPDARLAAGRTQDRQLQKYLGWAALHRWGFDLAALDQFVDVDEQCGRLVDSWSG
jgi:hypothetical protein